MCSEGYSTLSVCLSVCLFVCLSVYLYSIATGNEAAREQYTRLQHNKLSKNNVADLAKTIAFQQEKQIPPWNTFRDPTHQLAQCTCMFCYTLWHMLDWLSPWSSHCPKSCIALNATSSATSLFHNRCIRYRVCSYKVNGGNSGHARIVNI